MTIREASHAGSWYSDDERSLSQQLESWLGQARETTGEASIAVQGARVIIAPHAGYAYSGPAAAWAYKSLDLSRAQRVFLLGPSHHLYLNNCALSRHRQFATPLGNLQVDLETIQTLRSTGRFQDLTVAQDEAEHSLEMHLPYIYHLLSETFPAGQMPLLVPIMVGSTSQSSETVFGRMLAPYLEDPTNVFVVSSDFCHWGSRFSYTYYLPSPATQPGDGVVLGKRDAPSGQPIHQSIGQIDRSAMEAVSTGKHADFLGNLQETRNTVCGRHPIGVTMAAIEELQRTGKIEAGKGRFHFVRYERSSDVEMARDSSVSYASAYAVL